MSNHPNICIYTDGSCNMKDVKRQGAWGFAVVKECEGKEECIHYLYGKDYNTTNNAMELYAFFQALTYIKDNDLDPNKVTIYTDSQYVANGWNTWLKQYWLKTGWKTGECKTIANARVWKPIAHWYLKDYENKIKVKWINGHSGNYYNEFVDMICTYVRTGKEIIADELHRKVEKKLKNIFKVRSKLNAEL